MGMMLPPNLPAWVATVASFQDVGFFSKALLDAAAFDVPYALNAKNDQERRERIVQGSLIMAFAYGFSPIHSTLIARLCRQSIQGVQREERQALFRLPYHELETPEVFAKALKNALPHLHLEEQARTLLRSQVFQAKTTHLILDLAMEGLLLTSVPFIAKLSTKFLTGDSHFIGERNLAKQEDLNALYQKEKAEHPKQNETLHTLATLALGAGIPAGVGLGIRQALAHPTGVKSTFAPLMKWLKKVAPHFEYQYLDLKNPRWLQQALKEVPLLPVAALVPVFLAFDLGSLMSSRSKREFKETAVQKPFLFSCFFFVAPAIFRLFNHGATSIQQRLQQLVQKGATQAELNRVGRYSAMSFIGAYLMNILVTIGVVNWTNHMTRKGIQDEVNALHATPHSPPLRPTQG
jgi:hypothetical protein